MADFCNIFSLCRGIRLSYYPFYHAFGTSDQLRTSKKLSKSRHNDVGLSVSVRWKYVKIHVFNLVPYCIGLLFCDVVGVIVNSIFLWAGLGERNAMYLQHPPAEAPMFTCWSIAGLMILLIFIFTAIFEMFSYKKEQRFYKSTQFFWDYFPKPENKNKTKLVASKNPNDKL